MPFLFSAVVVAVMVFALVDLIISDESRVKHLPKFAWILLVILLPLIGSILWFTVGRERSAHANLNGFIPAGRASAAPASVAVPRDTRSTEEQIADLDREIEYYEKLAAVEKMRRERDAKLGSDDTV